MQSPSLRAPTGFCHLYSLVVLQRNLDAKSLPRNYGERGHGMIQCLPIAFSRETELIRSFTVPGRTLPFANEILHVQLVSSANGRSFSSFFFFPLSFRVRCPPSVNSQGGPGRCSIVQPAMATAFFFMPLHCNASLTALCTPSS